jgi:DNA processing protein
MISSKALIYLKYVLAGFRPKDLKIWEKVKNTPDSYDFVVLADKLSKVNNETLEKQIAIIEITKTKLILEDDPEYPGQLKEIEDYPYLLFAKSKNFQNNKRMNVAVVGCRTPSQYGRQIAYRIGYDLACLGFNVVSGLAMGIDACAHKGAIDAGAGTIAVLGTGVDVNYPACNHKLYNEIEKNGLILSEFPMKTPALPYHFPLRNRIISGLSRAVIIVEASNRSGALITANYALEQNRDVFAVPGDITRSTSKGTNNLIKDGAIPYLEIQSLLDNYNLKSPEKNIKDVPRNILLTDDEEKVLNCLNSDHKHLDEISSQTQISVKFVLKYLLHLQFMGLIKELPGKNYTLSEIG